MRRGGKRNTACQEKNTWFVSRKNSLTSALTLNIIWNVLLEIKMQQNAKIYFNNQVIVKVFSYLFITGTDQAEQIHSNVYTVIQHFKISTFTEHPIFSQTGVSALMCLSIPTLPEIHFIFVLIKIIVKDVKYHNQLVSRREIFQAKLVNVKLNVFLI